MRNPTFTAQSCSRYYQTKRSLFLEALELATKYARMTSLPAEIVDSHGCRWSVYSDGSYQLQDCPAVKLDQGPCECAGHDD